MLRSTGGFVVLCVALLWSSDAEAKKVKALGAAQIKKDMGHKDVIKIDVRPGGGAVENAEGLVYWDQTIEIHSKTEWKGITHILRGDVSYNWGGDRWVFAQFRKNDSWYEGVDKPTQADIDKALADEPAAGTAPTPEAKPTPAVKPPVVEPPKPDLNPKGYKVGDKIIGKQPHWKKEFAGEILKVHDNGKVRVRFSDGAVEDVPMANIRFANE